LSKFVSRSEDDDEFDDEEEASEARR